MVVTWFILMGVVALAQGQEKVQEKVQEKAVEEEKKEEVKAPVSFLTDDGVVILEPWVVDEFKEKYPNNMILLYGKGCGGCQWMMNDYKAAAKAAKEEGMNAAFAMINGQAFKDFSTNLGADAFPHIHVHGEKTPWGYKYDGKMKTADFLKEMRGHADGSHKVAPVKTTTLTNETYADFIDQPWSIVLFTSARHDNFMYPFINDVIAALEKDEEDVPPIGVLNVTEYKGVAPAEQATSLAAGYRRGVYFEFFPQVNVLDMKRHIVKRGVPPTEEVSLDSSPGLRAQYLEGENTDDALVLMLPATKTEAAIETFNKWSQWCYVNEHVACAHSFDKNLAKKYKIKSYTILWTRPDIFVPSKTQERQFTFPKTPLKKKIAFADVWRDHIKDKFLPAVGLFDSKHFKDMSFWIANTIVVCYFDVDLDYDYEKTKRTMNRIGTVAEKYFNINETSPDFKHAPVRFAVADEVTNGDFLERFSLERESEDDDPLIVIHNAYNHTKHAPTQEEQYMKNMKFEDYLESVVDRYLNGTLPPYLRSQTPPAKQTHPINTVVASTIDPIIMDESKDVLLYLTAEKDCPECEVIQKWLDEIAVTIASEKNMKMIKIDITKNDLDRKLFPNQRHPKLYMLPGGKKPEEAICFPFLRDMNLRSIKGFMGHYAVKSFQQCSAPKKTESVDDLMKTAEKPKKDEL